MHRIVGFVFVSLLCSACLFGPSRGSKVLGYHDGAVLLTSGGRYDVGRLPAGWDEWTRHGSTVRFRHADTGAMITTSAYCGASFEDLALPMLMGQLFAGIPPLAVEPPRTLSLDGRPALRARSRRAVDGVPLQYDAVIVKKHGCSFDFLLVTPPVHTATTTLVFETFVHGFHYE